MYLIDRSLSIKSNKEYSLLAAGVNAYNLASEHAAHMEHHPKEWVKYPYMNNRAKVKRKKKHMMNEAY